MAIYSIVEEFKSKPLLTIPALFAATGLLGITSSFTTTAITFVPLGILIAKRLDVVNAFAVGIIWLGSYTTFMTSPISTVATLIGQRFTGLEPF